MARKEDIVQGFVNINLENDEKTFYNKVFYPDSITDTSNLQYLTPPISLKKLIEMLGLELSNVQMAHIQGSRLYGVNNSQSDWDYSIVLNDFLAGYQFREINSFGENLDLHIYSNASFIQKVNSYFMREMEVVFHPNQVRLLDTINPELGYINTQIFAQKVSSDSDELWVRAENIFKTNSSSLYVAKKNIWHSIRFLIFAEQILKYGKINNFSAANYLYNEIINAKSSDFNYYFEKYNELRNYLKTLLI